MWLLILLAEGRRYRLFTRRIEEVVFFLNSLAEINTLIYDGDVIACSLQLDIVEIVEKRVISMDYSTDDCK